MELSYTQNMEDYHLSLAFAGQRSGIYVDVGAGHPVADNVSLWFYERGWRGVVVEPQQHLLALYSRVRPRDARVCALIGTGRGPADFHIFDRFHGLSTTVTAHAQAATALGAAFRTVQVPMMGLAELCERHDLKTIDFLKVDVEGAEADVLRSGDWRRFRPKVVVVEAIAPGSGAPAWDEWEPLLTGQCYRFALFDTLNRFYVAEEAVDVAARLPTERAPWDAVRHMYEIGRAPENPLHPDHALARRLAHGFWAMLPSVDRELVAEMLARGAQPSADKIGQDVVDSESFSLRLARIACGYDGGQIYKDDDGADQ
ncbi:MAG TPA: FkbM family methyltransferase [Bryobacteraceae bacterium]